MTSLIGLLLSLGKNAERKFGQVQASLHALIMTIAFMAGAVILLILALGIFAAAAYLLLVEVMHPAAALGILGALIFAAGAICLLVAQIFRSREK